MDNSWQAKVEGAYDRYCFDIEWEQKRVRCPQGNCSVTWRELADVYGPYYQVLYDRQTCLTCQARAFCTRSKNQERRLRLQPRPQYETIQAARLLQTTEAGKLLCNQRAGIEGTISQAVRAFGMRRTGYRGLAKTHLQNIATATGLNLDRLVAWFDNIPRAKTRTSRFARLALLATWFANSIGPLVYTKTVPLKLPGVSSGPAGTGRPGPGTAPGERPGRKRAGCRR